MELSMLIFTLKKMLRNKWMVSCLLLGAVVFASVLSIIPTYSNGVYRHMLLKDLEMQQIKSGEYPGDLQMFIQIGYDKDLVSEGYSRAGEFERLVEERIIPDMGLPVLMSRKYYSLDRFFYLKRPSEDIRQVSILGVEDFWDQVDIIDGRIPNVDSSSDVIEFAVSKVDYQKSDIRLDYEFDLFTYVLPRDTDRHYGRAVCVGVFEQRYDEPFVNAKIGHNQPTFIIDYDYLVNRFVEPESIFVLSKSFFYRLDYTEIRLENVDNILATTRRAKADIQNNGGFVFSMENTLRTYLERRDVLEFMLWILLIPVIIMLIIYIYMVSKLMIGYESNEIAVLKSRGARNMQIFSVYAMMSVFIAGCAVSTGPPLGLIASRVLGLANGFMELVSRRGLPLELTYSAYKYAGVAVLLFILVMLIPALRATGDTIVKSKQKKSHRISAPLWQKLFLDIVLIAVSLYALNLYRTDTYLRSLSDVSGVNTPVDPLILVACSLFVFGAALIFLRIFPLLIKLIFRLGSKIWPPSLYTTLLSISRFRGSSQFLMLFLVFNIGLGLFNATAARTLNRFLEERVEFENGADIVITQSWPTDTTHFRLEISESGEVSYHQVYSTQHISGESDTDSGNMILTRTEIKEPPFDVFQRLPGIEGVTKVFLRDKVSISTGHRSASATLMGIIPHEFGRIAWFRNDLLPTHINNYLNLMTIDPSAVYVSSSMREDYGLKVGDHIKVGWSEQSSSLDGTIYGFVDIWPSINPVTQPYFIIANLNSIHRQMRLEPYQVWISLNDNVSSLEFYEALNNDGVSVHTLTDTRQELIAVKNDPLLQGMNGTLTLGFIVTLSITFIGFLIYWVLSIKSRLLQFGILRAMGLSRIGVIITLMWEQLLISGSAIAAGFGVGVLASILYVPTLQLIYSASEQVPPFSITVNSSDYAALLLAFSGMLISGLSVLVVMIRRLKPDQVLKLGED